MRINNIVLGLMAMVGLSANAQTSAIVTHFGTITDACKWQEPITINMGEVQMGEVPEKTEIITLYCTAGTAYVVRPQQDATVFNGGTEQLTVTLWNADNTQITAANPITGNALNGLEWLSIKYRVNGESSIDLGKGSVVTSSQIYTISVPLVVEF